MSKIDNALSKFSVHEVTASFSYWIKNRVNFCKQCCCFLAVVIVRICVTFSNNFFHWLL